MTMYIDNLTLLGITVAATYLLIPFLFRRQMMVVEQDPDSSVSQAQVRGQDGALRACP